MTDSAFETLFRSVYPDLHRYFVRRLGFDEAEDAVAETLTAVLAKWRQAPNTLEEQRAWTFGFAANKLREAERSRIRDSKLVSAAAAGVGPESTGSHDAAIAAADRARELLGKLPEAERDAVYLTAIVGLTSAQAAQTLGCTVSAITTRVSRGRARLRELLATEIQEETTFNNTEGGQPQ
ncbi:MAG: RNA polymerase sigma factor [Promicromonosporaceae bacterium]|nr:RNA polymerase sigma factor [Promicromonosporaceae bacterium]